MDELKNIIAKNLAEYRKQAHLTQQELADKINYSDKAVSKWERAEGVPDIYVLDALAKLYGITVNDFLCEHTQVPPKVKTKSFWAKRWLITLLSVGLVFLIATVVMVIWLLVDPAKTPVVAKYAYLIALPAAFIVGLVFACLWGKLWQRCIVTSGLIWSLCLLIHLLLYTTQSNAWLIYLIGAVLQVLVVLWYVLAFLIRRTRNAKK